MLRFGVSLSDRPIEVEAIRRERPKIVYNGGRGQRTVVTNFENVFFGYLVIFQLQATWRIDRGDQYVGPGNVALLFIAHTCDKRIAEQMGATINDMARSRGMDLGRPFFYQYSDHSDPKDNMDHVTALCFFPSFSVVSKYQSRTTKRKFP